MNPLFEAGVWPGDAVDTLAFTRWLRAIAERNSACVILAATDGWITLDKLFYFSFSQAKLK